MRVSRIYQSSPLDVGMTVILDKHKSHYISHVLRLKTNDELIVFNGRGGEYSASIKAIEKHQVIVKVGDYSDVDLESPLHIHLAQGISRGERMDFALQKAVELGVKEITPLVTQRCNVKLSKEREENRMAHWRGIIESACEQSGRNKIPLLHEPTELRVWIMQQSDDLKLVLNHRAAKKLADVDGQINQIRLLIGPEGGLNAEEIAQAEQFNFCSVQLGSRVLRTETAALAAICCLQMRWGDF
jgi:16S rRNA (uracil1498-N3)-methyltransferase